MIKEIIDEIIRVEGGYTNNPNDTGGATNFGITEKVARANGFTGDMKFLPESVARDIYMQQYVIAPGFDKVAGISAHVGAELVDTGVNCGPAVAGKFLQRALNAFNDEQKHYPDLLVDGGCGAKTIEALKKYFAIRGRDGESTMLKALNCLQGAHYLSITESRPANENFCYGWIKNRINL